MPRSAPGTRSRCPDAHGAFALRAFALRAAALGLLLLLAAPVHAEDGAWRHLYTRRGIRVEAQDVPGRDLPRLRGTGVLPANLYELLAVLDDVPNHRTWVPRLHRSVALRRPSPLELWMYVRFRFPWPASDRDSVLHVQVSRTLTPHLHEIVLKSERAELPGRPPIDGVVRVPRSRGEARLRYLGPQQTMLTYLVDIDPGGSLPRFLVRILQEDLPMQIVEGLDRRISETPGRYEDFRDRWDPLRATTTTGQPQRPQPSPGGTP